MSDLPPYVPPGQQAPQNYGFTNDPNQQMMGGGMAPQQQQQQGNGLAVAGMVLGIIAIVLCWVPFLDQVLALLAIIFGAIGTGKANKIGGKGKGMAVAGLIMGIIAMILGIAVIVMAMSAARHSYSSHSYGNY